MKINEGKKTLFLLNSMDFVMDHFIAIFSMQRKRSTFQYAHCNDSIYPSCKIWSNFIRNIIWIWILHTLEYILIDISTLFMIGLLFKRTYYTKYHTNIGAMNRMFSAFLFLFIKTDIELWYIMVLLFAHFTISSTII